MELEPIVQSGLLAAVYRGIISLWRRWRGRPETETTTLRVDTPPGSHLLIIVIAPGGEPHVAVVTAPKEPA